MRGGHRDCARGTDFGPTAPRGGRRRLPRPARALPTPPPPSPLKNPGTCVSATSQSHRSPLGGASRHARAQGRRAPAAPPLPRLRPAPYSYAGSAGGALALLGGRRVRERAARPRAAHLVPSEKERPVGTAGGRPTGCEGRTRARARMGVSTRGKGGRFGGNGPSLRGVCAKPAPGLPSPPQLQSYRARCPASFRSPLPHPRSREARPQG